MRVLKWVGGGCLALLLAVVVAAWAFSRSQRGRALTDAMGRVMETDELNGRPLETADDVLDYLAAHPDRYSLALWNVGDEAHGVFHDPDSRWPLASTVKIVPLALASDRLASGTWDGGEPTPEVDAFYLPGSDGDAHPTALRSIDGGTSTLAGTLRAMIRFSDNAATDAVLLRLGRAELTAQLAALDPELGVPHPLSGTMLLARNGFDGGAAQLDDAAWATASRLLDPAEAAAVRRSFDDTGLDLTIAQQEAMTRELDNRGSPRAYARLVERLFSVEGDTVAKAQLSWPMELPANATAFTVLAAKGGSLPGTLTSAYFAQTKNGRKRVLALFFHDLPFATWLSLAKSFAQQKLERRLLLEDDALTMLQARLTQ